MTKTEQNCVVAWRLKLLRQANDLPRSVAQTCRHFGLLRKTFYKWRAKYKNHGEAGLCDRPRAHLHSTRTSPENLLGPILEVPPRNCFMTRSNVYAATTP